MPWLDDLVESCEGTLNTLPVQCLCEYLLNSSGINSEEEANSSSSKKQLRRREVLLHLQSILQQPEYSERRASFETLDYFMRRLSFQQTQQRSQVSFNRSLLVKTLPGLKDRICWIKW